MRTFSDKRKDPVSYLFNKLEIIAVRTSLIYHAGQPEKTAMICGGYEEEMLTGAKDFFFSSDIPTQHISFDQSNKIVI